MSIKTLVKQNYVGKFFKTSKVCYFCHKKKDFEYVYFEYYIDNSFLAKVRVKYICTDCINSNARYQAILNNK